MLKTVSSVINAIGALNYKGTWDAATNTPTLVSSVGTKGDYYVVSVAGTTNLNGITDWQINDWALFNGSIWQKVDNTDLVVSVNGKTGAVVLGATDVGATPNTAYVLTSGLLSGGGQLTGNVTVDITSVPVANVTGAVANTTTVSAGGLLSGGGNLASNITISLTDVPVANVTGAVPNTVNVLAGGLLTGGGALTGNVTISLTSVPSGNVSGLGTMATQNANDVNITGGSISGTNVSTSNATITGGSINVQTTNLTATTTANATFATSSLQLVPAGYLEVDLNGTVVKVPYYAV